MKHIIFDVDGLLVDTEPIHYESWGLIFQRHGLHISDEEYGKLFVGTSDLFVAQWLIRKGHSSDEPEVLVKEKAALFWENCIKAKPLPGVVSLLEKLNGSPMSVASSSNLDVVKRMLNGAGLESYFLYMTGGDEVENLKPAPDIYLLAVKKAGVSANECVALEDSESGASSAIAAGVRAIAVPTIWTKTQLFPKNCTIVNSILEAEELIRKN